MRAAAAALILGVLTALSGCTALTTSPAETGPTAVPVSRLQFACPTAGSLSALVALPLALSTSGAACIYAADDAGHPVRITVRHPAAPSSETLAAARAVVAKYAVVTSAGDLGFEAFTARSPKGTCTAWVTAADGAVTSVTARHAGWSAARACTLARATVTLMGTAPTPIVSAVTAATLTAARGDAEQWTARLADRLGLHVDALPSSGSGYLPSSGSTAVLSADASKIDPRSTAVVLVSGVSDARATQLQVLKAATTSFSKVRSAAPRARLIVVGPVQAGAEPTGAELALRDDLERAASIGGATFVDPIASRWGSGAAATTTRLAARVEQVLRASAICPAFVPATAPAAACDASKSASGAVQPMPAPSWTPSAAS